jgi:hypothetical protein
MVKMETTEPTVELKLKKGGEVSKKMARGGMPMGASVGAPRGGVMAGTAPGMPNLAARRRAMRATGAATPAPVGPAATMMGMKEGGESDLAQDKAMIKKAFKQHDMQEHKGGKGTKIKLKDGGLAKKMEKFETQTTIEGNEGKYDTTKMVTAKVDRRKGSSGEVKESNAGGFKRGGAISAEKTYGNFDKTEVHEGRHDSAHGTGGIREQNAGGFKRGGRAKMATGGVMETNAGGYRKGGAAKKFAEGGRVQHDGGPEQMPQGRKKPAGPVSINQLSGTYKKGGAVMMAEGGDPNADFYRRKTAENEADAKAMKDALLYIPRKIHKAGKSIADAISPGKGSVTDTEREVSRTVVPGKKRGGAVC